MCVYVRVASFSTAWYVCLALCCLPDLVFLFQATNHSVNGLLEMMEVDRLVIKSCRNLCVCVCLCVCAHTHAPVCVCVCVHVLLSRHFIWWCYWPTDVSSNGAAFGAVCVCVCVCVC